MQSISGVCPPPGLSLKEARKEKATNALEQVLEQLPEPRELRVRSRTRRALDWFQLMTAQPIPVASVRPSARVRSGIPAPPVQAKIQVQVQVRYQFQIVISSSIHSFQKTFIYSNRNH